MRSGDKTCINVYYSMTCNGKKNYKQSKCPAVGEGQVNNGTDSHITDRIDSH